MACGCSKKQPVAYQVIYKGGEPTEEVKTLAEVRTKLASSSRGGHHKAVFAK